VTDRHPDLAGRLRYEIVKPGRGEQANGSHGNLVSRFDEGGVPGSGEIPREIEIPADLFQVPRRASRGRYVRGMVSDS
jgi:hypothetical protein